MDVNRLYFAFQALSTAYDDELRAYSSSERFELEKIRERAKKTVRRSRREQMCYYGYEFWGLQKILKTLNLDLNNSKSY